jgi:hypothetical protein
MTAARPKVFLSFAGNDRVIARRLADDLERYGVEAFYDARDVALGGNVVLSINRAMAESHYYVLLWSANCVDRPWVGEEWAAAYAMEIHLERSFLFIVRLDETPLPPLLAVRRYLNGIRDWPAVARDLADAWLDDVDTGTPVFPPPDPVPQIERSALVVRIRNQALVMTHVIGIPPESTGHDLLPTIRTALALPASELNGTMRTQFTYRLLHDGEPVRDGPITAQGITEGATLDLEIQVLAIGPDGPFGERVYRRAEDPIPSASDRAIRAMVNTAFAHLTPWGRRMSTSPI